MATVEVVLSDVISKVSANTRNPEDFLSIQESTAAVFKKATKQLYDLTKSEISRKNNALPELVTDGFDEEQVWQQLELQNNSELSHFLGKISRMLSTRGSDLLTLPISPEIRKQEVNDEEEGLYEDPVKEDDLADQEDEDEDQDEDEDEDEDKDEEEENVSRKRPRFTEEFGTKRKGKPSVVDDKFFKLQDLEEYLTKEDNKESREKKKNLESDEDSDDESVDLFNDISDEEEGGDGSSEEGKDVKYADFFDSPEDEDPEKESNAEVDEVTEETKEDSRKKKKVKFNLTNDSDDSNSLEKPEEEEEKMENDVKSSLEARQERLRKRIEDMEEEAISEKPWQLKGEVSGLHRPQNSLLEEYVEFDVTSRPAPIITEQTTLKLEDIIKQRIKDKAWDDVEKKFKPVETPLEYKKKLVLDQEKSKESLAQIYENEYLKQKEALDPENAEREKEEPKEHIEIREMMGSLFRKLDALSNFHYTPKLAKPEIKIISNLPAISMEEVAPVATSDGALLAPEEIAVKPRGDLMGKSERTKTDMKRERRRKKTKQRAIQKAKETKEKSAVSKVPKKKGKVQISSSVIAKLSKDRNVSRMEETSEKAVKSSTAFFDRLQDQVKKQIAGKTTARKKNKSELSAVKLKL